MSRVPLAWKNLTHDPRRLAVAVAGISFAVLLMFQQRGFSLALFDSTVALIKQIDADLVIVDRGRFSISAEIRFERHLLDVVQGNANVDSVIPLFAENSLALLRRAGTRARPIRVIAYDTAQAVMTDTRGRPLELGELLSRPGSAVIDRFSKREYGFDLDHLNAATPQLGELSGRRVQILGGFKLGRDFANEGTLIMDERSFAEYFSYRNPGAPLDIVDFGLVRVRPGTDLALVKRELESQLSSGLLVLTRAELIQMETRFWSRSTPIGIIFSVGAVIGFAVGVIICYQILANDIADHLSEFATLKAMGYSNGYFFQMVIGESIYLSILGFIPGLLISLLMFRVNTSITGLLMMMTWDRGLQVFLFTVAMCILSGILALRKLVSSDPANLF